ncbi:MAG: polysaccharide biosynthesis C-terminal domain-containing protein [Nitrospira sp.]|nr:polysaccharide biosynthesis C-terminal domain-containing protein [Nitrospira sp.]MBX3339081.1 polysaccharide biosynthesis C-terminal domain-containing protein [Nitrospira sp.]MCW5778001.1 polysaccharide biosynthesis C-terminal domain-containing protein [Nitrospira sp.]
MSEKSRSGLSIQSWASASILLIAVALLSKGLGFFRELLGAKYFGTSGDVDAFFVALSMALLANSGIGIALSTVLIPAVHNLRLDARKQAAAQLIGRVIVATVILSITMILPLILFPELVVRIFVPYLSPRVGSMAASFMPWLAWYGLLLNLVFVLAAAFNAQRHFVVPAFSDLAFNLVAVSILVMFAATLGVNALVASSVLGMGTCGGILFFLLWRHQLARFDLHERGEDIRPFLHLCIPILLLEISCQIITAVENYFASGLAEGSIAALNYARRISVMIVTLVALNISRGVFPTFSLLWLEGKQEEAAEILMRISTMIIAIFVPVAVSCVVLRDQVVGILYMRGAFDRNALEVTAAVFIFYSAGLVVAVLEPVFIKACYAFGDTRTPLYSTAISAAVMTGGTYLLTPLWGIAGIALMMNLSIALRTLLMAVALNKMVRHFDLGDLGASGLGSLVCAAVALACSSVVLHETPLGLMLWCMAFGATYLSCGWFFMKGEIRPLVWKVARIGMGMWGR